MKYTNLCLLLIFGCVKVWAAEIKEPVISIIAAVSKNKTIGDKGSIPWHIPNDLKRFMKLTIKKPCIMGRKTWESLPRKPLRGRTNIVVSSGELEAGGAHTTHSFKEAIKAAKKEKPSEIMVIGGASIYKEALSVATVIYLTAINEDIEGDVKFPDFDEAKWEQVSKKGPYLHEGLSYFYITLLKKMQ